MGQMKKRKADIAVMNVFLCLLVIFIHVSSAPVTTYDKSSLQYAVVFLLWRYASCAVQGFIFLGGLRFFLTKKDGIDYKAFYKERFVKIIIPYILWNIIYYLLFVFKGYFPFSFEDFGLYLIKGNLISPFYFVVVIIQFYALAPLWRWLVIKVHVVAALVVAGIITLFLGQYLPVLISAVFPGYGFRYNDRVLTTYLFYWLAGCYVGMHLEKVQFWLKNHKKLVLISLVLVMLGEGALGYISFSGIRYISWLENVHFLYCVCTVLFIFTLFSVVFENRSLKSKLLIEADRASYLIFLSHCIVIFAVNNVMASMGINSITLSYLIRIITVYSTAILGCILWYRLKTRVISTLKIKTHV